MNHRFDPGVRWRRAKKAEGKNFRVSHLGAAGDGHCTAPELHPGPHAHGHVVAQGAAVHDGPVPDGAATAHGAVLVVVEVQAAVLLHIGALADADAAGDVEQHGGGAVDLHVADDGGVGRDARLGVNLHLAVVHVPVLLRLPARIAPAHLSAERARKKRPKCAKRRIGAGNWRGNWAVSSGAHLEDLVSGPYDVGEEPSLA